MLASGLLVGENSLNKVEKRGLEWVINDSMPIPVQA